MFSFFIIFLGLYMCGEIVHSSLHAAVQRTRVTLIEFSIAARASPRGWTLARASFEDFNPIRLKVYFNTATKWAVLLVLSMFWEVSDFIAQIFERAFA